MKIHSIFLKFQINFSEKFAHPCVEKPSNTLDEEAIFRLDRFYFSDFLKYAHLFKFKTSSDESCENCYNGIDDQKDLIDLVAKVYKDFKFDYFAIKLDNNDLEIITKHSLIEFTTKTNQSIKSIYSLNSEHYRTFICKFIDNNYQLFSFSLVLDM